ncbi:hypothetical protein BGW41_005999 [Actinomortierella wolfii]|nr:hypothetical protein BGW41_005999 [Actinomortierella wolfii]
MESYPNPYSALIATFNQVSPADSPSKDDLDDVQNFPDDDLLLWANAQFTFDTPSESGAYEEDLGLNLSNTVLPGDQQQQLPPHSHDSQLQHHRQLLIQKQQQLISLQLQQQQLQQQQQQQQQQQRQQQQSPTQQQTLQYGPQLSQQHSFHHVETADPRTLSVLERSRRRNPIQHIAPNPTTNGTESGFSVQARQQQQLHSQQALHYQHNVLGLYTSSEASVTSGPQAATLLPHSRGYPAATAAGAPTATTAHLARPGLVSHGTHSTSTEAALDSAILSPTSETGSMSLSDLRITSTPISVQAPSATLPVTTPIDEHGPRLAGPEGESSDDEYDDTDGAAKESGSEQASSAAGTANSQSRRPASTKVPLSKDDPDYAAKLAAEEDKRRRNTAASARFRQKKRLREQALERTAREMTLKSEALEARVKELEMEIKWLRGLIIEKDSRMLENMPPIKAIVAATTSANSNDDDSAAGSEGSSNKRGAPTAGGSSANSNDTAASGRKASSRRSKAT